MPSRTTKPAPDISHIPETGFLRLPQILAIFPIGKSTWWLKVSKGEFPQPIKIGPRTTVWRAQDIRALIDKYSAR